MELAALATAASTVTLVPITGHDWLWFALLAVAAIVHLEAARGLERVREVTAEGSPHTHLQSVWFFAAVLLLPPPLIVGILVISYLHSWFRVYRRRALPHRKVFSLATVVLACAGAYAVLAAIYPGNDGEAFAMTLTGPVGLVAVVAAGLIYRLVNYSLVVGVILATNPDRPARKALGNGSDQLMIAGAVGLGTGIAVVMTSQPWSTPVLIVTVLALHTGLLLPQFRDASRTDAKTGLFEPTFWAELTGDELDRSRRLGGSLGMLLLDLDHFKRVNDAYGHLAGDHVLRAVADAVKHAVRGHDMVGRYGGEEFAVVLPGLGREDVRLAAERVRAAVAELAVTVLDLDGHEQVITGLTASVGAAVYPDHGADRTTLMLAADAALYEAKAAGRNRTCIAGETSRDIPTDAERKQWPRIPAARKPD